MTHGIDAGRELLWPHPVFMRIGNGFPERIGGPQQAIEALNVRWPCKRGPIYLHAMELCAAALSTKISAGLDREAFVSAALEADVLA